MLRSIAPDRCLLPSHQGDIARGLLRPTAPTARRATDLRAVATAGIVRAYGDGTIAGRRGGREGVRRRAATGRVVLRHVEHRCLGSGEWEDAGGARLLAAVRVRQRRREVLWLRKRFSVRSVLWLSAGQHLDGCCLLARLEDEELFAAYGVATMLGC